MRPHTGFRVLRVGTGTADIPDGLKGEPLDAATADVPQEMNPRYYPVVSRLFQTHFPDRYNRITLGEAWEWLWKRGEFIREGGKVFNDRS